MKNETNSKYLIERALSFAAMSCNCKVTITYNEATGETSVVIESDPYETEA